MPAPLTVVVADFLGEAGVEIPILQDVAKVVIAGATNEESLLKFLPDADAILLFHNIEKVGEASFNAAPRCRCLVRAGVGYNNVDLDAANRHGVSVCNVPDYGTEEVADHAIMFLLAMARRLIPCHEAITKGEWHYATAVGTPRLRGKTFGVIGCGTIGTATALRAKAFGLNVVFYDPLLPQGVDKALGIRRAQRLEDLLGQSDFVSLHCYLNATTRHMINAETIAKMKPGTYLINTARGPVIDEEALLVGLDSGQIAGAALDVVEHEPLADERLRRHPKILFTPHSAFYSVEGFVELRSKAAMEIRRILVGEEPWNRVNRPTTRSVF